MQNKNIYRKKILATLCLTAMLSLPVAAQKITVAKTVVDVGRTGYMQPVTAVFEFRNKSIRKLKIEDVRPDCNCTVVEYPKGDIGIGDRFEVKMTYDARQLGHFDKQAAIISNGSKKPFYIRMKGVVLADVHDFSGTYPVEMGDLRLDKSELEFDDVNKGDLPMQELHIYNNGTRAYQPNLMHLPDYLTAAVLPETLPPGRAGKIVVTLHSAKLRDYGLTQTSVYLAGNPGDKVSADNGISVSAVLLPSFMDMTGSQQQNAAKIRLSTEQVNIVFDGKSKKTESIDISNDGRTALDISSLQLFTGGLKISLGKRKLQPGESTKLKITAMRDELKKVRTRPRVLMITNDPAKPKVVIQINCK